MRKLRKEQHNQESNQDFFSVLPKIPAVEWKKPQPLDSKASVFLLTLSWGNEIKIQVVKILQTSQSDRFQQILRCCDVPKTFSELKNPPALRLFFSSTKSPHVPYRYKRPFILFQSWFAVQTPGHKNFPGACAHHHTSDVDSSGEFPQRRELLFSLMNSQTILSPS